MMRWVRFVPVVSSILVITAGCGDSGSSETAPDASTIGDDAETARTETVESIDSAPTDVALGLDDGVVYGPREGSDPPGLDPAYDELWEECAAGEMGDPCDQLFFDVPLGSEFHAYELFGLTCGGRTESESCTELLGSEGEVEPLVRAQFTNKLGHWDLGSIPATGTSAPGDDPELDELWESCSAGDSDACLSLHADAPFGGEYEAYGASCGGRKAIPSRSCWVMLADPLVYVSEGSPPPGDDPVLDELWIDCADGDGGACLDLSVDSEPKSDYDFWGSTCGGRVDPPVVLTACVDYSLP